MKKYVMNSFGAIREIDDTPFTPYELADYLDNNVEAMLMSEQHYIDEAAIMLRKQQLTIEDLKDTLQLAGLKREER